MARIGISRVECLDGSRKEFINDGSHRIDRSSKEEEGRKAYALKQVSLQPQAGQMQKALAALGVSHTHQWMGPTTVTPGLPP